MELEEFMQLLKEKKLSEVKNSLLEMNEFDIASLIEELPEDKIVQAFRLLPKNMATDVFVNMDDEIQKKLISSLTSTESKAIIEDMFTDDAADLFEEMPAIMVRRLLSNIDKNTRAEINKLLKYPEDSAGSLMAMEYIHLKKGLTIRQSIERIRKQKDEFVSYDSCFVTDNERKLLGYVTIKDILINDPDTMIDDIMQECEHTLTTLMDQEEVANIFQDYNYSTLPVVDSENRLVGIITKMAAITPTDKPYMKTGVFETWKKRIPWLLLLMVSATFTGSIITHFEGALAAYVVLTSFIPMLMDSGGNAGSQASVSVIRALSLDEIEFKDTFKVIWKEFRVALLCGIVLAICNFIKLMIIDKVGAPVAAVVCITLLVTIVFAKFVGCTLPILAKKCKLDPAVMASPFITTIVDACSLLIYFKVAGIFLGI